MDDQLQQILNNIAGKNPIELQREKGDYQFTDIKKEIDSVINFAKDLVNNPDFFNTLPESQQNDLRNGLEQLQNITDQMASFNPPDYGNPQDQRNNLANQLKDIYQRLFDAINKLDIYRLKTAGSQAKLSNSQKELELYVKQGKDSIKEISDLLATAKKTTSKVALQKYLGIFEAEAKKYKDLSHKWLKASAAVVVVTLGLLFWVALDFDRNIKSFQNSQSLVAFVVLKLFFLAIIIYILQQFVRNYMANMHQSILNEHRENSLKVFDAMVRSSSDPRTTDEVLSYLSKSIFDSGETGFFPGKDISKDGPDLVQIFKDAGKVK